MQSGIKEIPDKTLRRFLSDKEKTVQEGTQTVYDFANLKIVFSG